MRISDWSSDVCSSDLYDYQPILDLITRMDKPVIAAVNGAAAGMGLSMALACDLLVMSANAYLLSPFVGIGLIPDGDRKSVVTGTSVSVRVDLGGRRIIKKKRQYNES